MKKRRLGYADTGDEGRPGTGYSKRVAFVTELRPSRYQIDVRSIWGSNQGYLQEEGRVERKYRADSLAELLRVAIAETRGDDEFPSPAKLCEAIRQAVFEAEDSLDTSAERTHSP